MICILIGSFRAKCIMFDLKSTEELSFMTLKWHVKLLKKRISDLENDMRNFSNFHQNPWKHQNWDFDGILFFSKIENAWVRKSKAELCVMTLKNDEKFEEEMVSHFKITIKNLAWALESIKNLHFNGLLLTKVYVWAKTIQMSYLLWHCRVMRNLKSNWLAISKST